MVADSEQLTAQTSLVVYDRVAAAILCPLRMNVCVIDLSWTSIHDFSCCDYYSHTENCCNAPPLFICYLICTDPPPGLPPVIIAKNTFTEGSSINVNVVVAAGQDNGGDPRLSQVSCADFL